MVKILTFNADITTNLSYAHTFKRLINNMDDRFKWLYGSYNFNGKPINDGNITILPAPIYPNKMPKNFRQIIDKYKPNIFFMHEDPQYLEWVNNRVLKGTPSVLWLPWDNESKPNRYVNIFDNFGLVVVVSKFAQSIFSNAGVKVPQIYNPIKTNVYYEDSNAEDMVREKFQLPPKEEDDAKYLMWLGRPGWRKRLIHNIEGFKRVKERSDQKVRLILHSDLREGELKWNIRELLHSMDLTHDDVIIPNMHFAKGLPEEFLRGEYTMADVYISAHGGEGMNLPVVEAMSCKTPFVMTDFTTTREFAGLPLNDKSKDFGPRGIAAKVDKFFIDKGVRRPYVDLEDFTSKILYLLNNDSVRNNMGKKGRIFALRNCSCRKVSSQWESIFNKMSNVNTIKVQD